MKINGVASILPLTGRIDLPLSAAQAAACLGRPGAVAVVPTDTVYGLVARAADVNAVARLYGLKRREHKPGTVIAAGIDQLTDLGVKRRYLKAALRFWPGAVSVIIPSGPELGYLHLGQASLAVRLPEDAALGQLLKQTGPLLTSSANQPGQPIAGTVAQARAYFGAQVDGYMDGGDLSGRQPSTLLRVVDDAVEVLRQGNVTL